MGLIDGDVPALGGVELLLGLDRDDDALGLVLRILMDQDQVGVAGPDGQRPRSVALDLATAVDRCAVGWPRDPEQVEGQPRVVLEEEEDALMKRTWHIPCVGPVRGRLQGIAKKIGERLCVPQRSGALFPQSRPCRWLSCPR